MIKQEGTHFLSLDRADWMVTSAGIRTYFHLLFIFFHLLTLSVYHALTVFVRRASVSVSTHFHTHKEKGNKVLVELWVFPWSEYKALWFVSAHVLLPLQLKELIVLSNIPVWYNHWLMHWPSSCLMETQTHTEVPAPLLTHLNSCDVDMGDLSWVLACFDGGPCRGRFTCCFDPCCQSPVSSHRHSWLGWSQQGYIGSWRTWIFASTFYT